nr:MAG TPA: hypothetical protein [Caudoviricetes sp.]
MLPIWLKTEKPLKRVLISSAFNGQKRILRRLDGGAVQNAMR